MTPRSLTNREREILRHIVTGEPSKTIARKLGIAESTVWTHRRRIMEKLGVHSLAELVVATVREHLAN